MRRVRLAAALGCERWAGGLRRHKQKRSAACWRSDSGIGRRAEAGAAAGSSGHGVAAGDAGADAVAGGRWLGYGPGVLDMKAGVVMALAALKLVREVDAGPAGSAAAERR